MTMTIKNNKAALVLLSQLDQSATIVCGDEDLDKADYYVFSSEDAAEAYCQRNTYRPTCVTAQDVANFIKKNENILVAIVGDRMHDKRKAYQKAYYEKLKNNPVALAAKREKQRQQAKQRRENPELRARENAKNREWKRAERLRNPEFAEKERLAAAASRKKKKGLI